MKEQNTREFVTIDLMKLLGAYLRYWWVIVISAVVVAAGVYFYTLLAITPMYDASVTVYVNNRSRSEQVDAINSSNLSAAQTLVKTYVRIIQSYAVLDKVVSEGNLDCSSAALRGKLSAKQVASTEMFEVHIKDADPEMAAHIANVVAAVAPSEIENIVEGSSTKIVDYAKVPRFPSSPNKTRNTFMGGLIGGAAAVLVLTMQVLFDVRIKTSEDLGELTELPVLGQVPDFEQLEANQNRRGYGRHSEAAMSYENSGYHQ